MKVVGLSEAIISFMETFSDLPCETMHTQKNKQFYFQAETNFWMVMTVSVPTQKRVLEGEKGVEGEVVVDYLEDQVIDETYLAVLKKTYYMFKMFNGSLTGIHCQHSIENLKLRVEHFCNKYLPTLDLKHADIMDVFGGLFFLPLHQNSYLTVQSFVHKFECTYPAVQDTLLLYNSQLVWSGLEQDDTKLMFHFLLSSVYPAILDRDFSSTHPILSSTTPPSSHRTLPSTTPPLTHPILQSTLPNPSSSNFSSSINSSSSNNTPLNTNDPSLSKVPDPSSIHQPSPLSTPILAPTTTFHQSSLKTSLPSSTPSYDTIKIGGYTLGPPDLSNPRNIGQIPLVYLPTHLPLNLSHTSISHSPIYNSLHSNNSTCMHASNNPSNNASNNPSTPLSLTPPSSVCRLLVYKLYDALLCIFVKGSEDPSFQLMASMDAYLCHHLPPLVSLFVSTIKKGSSEQVYKYVYYNAVNGAQKSTIHNPHHTALSTSPQLLQTISAIHYDLNCNTEREEEGCETMVKVGEGGWVVGRRGEGRELYVVVEQKASSLVSVNDEVKKMCSSHFQNLFFTD